MSHATINPIVVSWQALRDHKIRALLEEDVSSDFCFWRASKDYDPLKADYSFANSDELRLGHFHLHETSHNVALQIDLCRPAYDILKLRYPDAAFYEMLSIDEHVFSGFSKFDVAQNWLGLTATTTTDHGLSAIRRSIVFPNTDMLNEASGCAYDNVTPSFRFAQILETSLNAYIENALAYFYYNHNLGHGRGNPELPVFEFIY